MRVGEHALQEVLAHVVREADRLLLELRHRKSKAFLLARSPSSPLATLFLLFRLCLRLLLQICLSGTCHLRSDIFKEPFASREGDLVHLTALGTRPDRDRSGKWSVNTNKAIDACNSLAGSLDLNMHDLAMSSLAATCKVSSFRDGSCRYKDPPEIRALIHQRKKLRGNPARDMGKHIARLRAAAKQRRYTELLDRGAAGDYKVISFFK